MKRFLMVSIVAVNLFGCSPSPEVSMEINRKRIDEVNARIDKVVSDPERAQAMKAAVAEFDQQLLNQKTILENKRDAIIVANTVFSTSRANLELLYDELNNETRVLYGYIKDIHVTLTSLATPEEWTTITRGKKRLFAYN